MSKRTWRQDSETGKLVEVVRQTSYRGHFVLANNVDFISPVDGSHIKSSRQLVEHNKKHGVSNDLDSLREQTAKAVPKELSRQERRDAIADSIERASSSGYSRRAEYDK